MVAYGREGIQFIIQNGIENAQYLANKIKESNLFDLIGSNVNLNIVCFKPKNKNINIAQLLDDIKKEGKAYFGPATIFGTNAMRAAFCNWRTTQKDVDISFTTLVSNLQKQMKS